MSSAVMMMTCSRFGVFDSCARAALAAAANSRSAKPQRNSIRCFMVEPGEEAGWEDGSTITSRLCARKTKPVFQEGCGGLCRCQLAGAGQSCGGRVDRVPAALRHPRVPLHGALQGAAAHARRGSRAARTGHCCSADARAVERPAEHVPDMLPVRCPPAGNPAHPILGAPTPRQARARRRDSATSTEDKEELEAGRYCTRHSIPPIPTSPRSQGRGLFVAPRHAECDPEKPAMRRGGLLGEGRTGPVAASARARTVSCALSTPKPAVAKRVGRQSDA